MNMTNLNSLVSWITLIGIFIGLYFAYIKLDENKKETVQDHAFTAFLLLCFVLAAYLKRLISGEIGKSEIISAAAFETVVMYFSLILVLILLPIFILIFRSLDLLRRYSSAALEMSKSENEIMKSQSETSRETLEIVGLILESLKSSAGREKEKLMEEMKTLIEPNQRID
jgi:hypothetical protein